MEMRKETKWLCENARALEQFSGQWVMFNAGEGTFRKNESLSRLLKSAPSESPGARPFVFHVPSKRALAAAVFGTSR